MAKTRKTEIQNWLASKLRAQGRSSMIAGVCLMALGLAVLFLQFWVVYGFVWIVSQSGLSHWGRIFYALVGTGLLFLGNKFASTDELDALQLKLEPNRFISSVQLRSVGYGALSAFSSFENAPGLVKFVTIPLFMGPRIIMAAVGMIRQGMALKDFDHLACGRVLNSIIRAGKRVSFEQLGEKFSELDLERIVPQLMLLDGVILLKSEPIGLTIGPDMIEEFHTWLEKTSDRDG
jgi:hypothetical protein